MTLFLEIKIKEMETSKLKRQYFHDKDLQPHIKEEHDFPTVTSIKTQSGTQEFVTNQVMLPSQQR